MKEDRGKDPGKEPLERTELSFGGLLKGLGNFSKMIADMEKEGKSEIIKSGEFTDKDKVKVVYGYTLRLGLEGLNFERFGNLQEDGSITEEIEPITDIFDEDEKTVIILELPGVKEDALTVELTEGKLTVRGRDRDKAYAKTVDLHAGIDPSSMEKSYLNGVLELKFTKKTSR